MKYNVSKEISDRLIEILHKYDSICWTEELAEAAVQELLASIYSLSKELREEGCQNEYNNGKKKTS